MNRPRPRVTGKINPGVVGKGESPVGDSARTVPRKLTSTRSEAALQLLQKYGKSKRHLRTGDFRDVCGTETDFD